MENLVLPAPPFSVLMLLLGVALGAAGTWAFPKIWWLLGWPTGLLVIVVALNTLALRDPSHDPAETVLWLFLLPYVLVYPIFWTVVGWSIGSPAGIALRRMGVRPPPDPTDQTGKA